MVTLIPVIGSYAAVVDLAKRSPQAADALARIALFESLSDQIEQVRPALTSDVLSNIAKLNERARVALLRNHVGKSLDGQAPDDAGMASALAVIDEFVEKSLVGDLLERFNRSHPRDDRGRFIRADVSPRTQMIAGDLRSRDVLNRTKGQLSRWKQAKLIADDTPVTIQYRFLDEDGKPHGSVKEHESTGGTAAADAEALLNEANVLPVGLAVARRNIPKLSPKELAAIDLTSLATGADAATSRRLTQGLFDAQGQPKRVGSAAQDWYGQTEGTDRQAYRRIGMTGAALSAASAPGSLGSAVGAMGQLVGDLGPEAEKVLGPGIRRAAYRYRGTERRPDSSIRRSVVDADKYARALSNTNEAGREKAVETLRNLASMRGGKDPVISIAATNYLAPGISSDQRALGLRGDSVVAEMLGATGKKSLLPDRELTQLSIESGEMPPSEGVMIDADGNVVTQAVGYNGDHYLPFDLRNLNALHGGQYIRTRATGGLTTEDIYTGLLTGTRQIQVVSNSGVFTLEFDPDLRGGRRYSDKAKRMIERYGSMLEAINSKELYQQDLDPGAKADIRRKVAEVTTNPTEANRIYQQKLQEARFKAALGDDDVEELEAAAETYAEAKTSAEVQDRRRRGETLSGANRAQIKETHRRDYLQRQAPAVRRLRLDGEGYSRAMRALKQEFPYYIRQATFQPLPEWLEQHGLGNEQGHKYGAGSDTGYVQQGQTNTAAAMVGGFRSARRVPTTRLRAEGTTEGAQTTQAQPSERPAAAATPQAATTAAPAGPKPISLENELKPGGGVHTALMNPLGHLIIDRADIPPEHDAIDPDTPASSAAGYHGSVWANWKASQLINAAGGRQRAGSTAATWLLTQATPQERAEMLAGLEELEADTQLYKETQGRAAQVRLNYDKVRDIIDTVNPFAPTLEGEEPASVMPEGDEPKPQRFEGIVPDITAPAEEFERRRKELELGVDQQSFAQEFADLAGETNDERAAYVTDAIQRARRASGEEQDALMAAVVRAQVAWSFLAAEEASKALRRMIGGGAGPKDETSGLQKSAGQPPSQLDQFLHSLQAEIEGLLQP